MRRSSSIVLVFVTVASLAAVARADTAPNRPTGPVIGIDVSHWQDVIDWSRVASSGVSFAIVKATQGRTYVDPMYAINYAGATAAGVPFTAYHFAEPDATPRDAVAEADHFVATAALGPGNIVPALDLERTGGLSQPELTTWVLRWLDRVTDRLGVRPMVYTSPSGWAGRTGDTSAIADAGYTVLWVAHWGVARPVVPGDDWGGRGPTFWQYSDCVAVPGIDGCVDGDRFVGDSLDDVTIPGARAGAPNPAPTPTATPTPKPDTTPPTVTIATPGGLGRPVVVSFSEAVTGVTPDDVALTMPDVAQVVPSRLTCASVTGSPVRCSSGPVRTVTLESEAPLVAAQKYSVVVSPASGSPGILDDAGNPVAQTAAEFMTPSAVEEDSAGIVEEWPERRDPRAIDGSYAVEHLAGDSYSFPFTGRSVTWYTVAGPAQGRAEVLIDGVPQAVFDHYAPRPSFGVAHRFSGLSRGSHTIEIRVLGTSSRAASDSQVAVDAFRAPRGAAAAGDAPAGEDAMQRWRTADIAGTSGGSAGLADVAGASATFVFRGTGVRWTTIRGPAQGRAAIFVDGELVRTVDDYAPRPAAGVVRSVENLIIGVHTLRIVVLGNADPRARGTFVAIDRLAVVP